MDKQLSDLIEISRYYGRKKDYVIAGGGNTSCKNEKKIWVKGSGISLKDVNPEDFAVLHRGLLRAMTGKKYNSDPFTREAEVKKDLQLACVDGISVRPSVETSLHEIINYAFVVHTHPTLINAVICSANAKDNVYSLFGESVLYIPYMDPGYILFSAVHESLLNWRADHPQDPHVILLQNHGVFVAADSINEIKELYAMLEKAVKSRISELPDTSAIEISGNITGILPALRMIYSGETLKIARIHNSRLIQYFTSSAVRFAEVSKPFTPDQIVYCKAWPIFLESSSAEEMINECRLKTTEYMKEHGFLPKVAGIKGVGIVALDDSIRSVEIILEIFEDWMKICRLSQYFGGPHYMSNCDISFIDTWEVENYRRKMATTGRSGRKAENKIVIITGGAQGFGEGIVQNMFMEGANVVIADVNDEKGLALAAQLNKTSTGNEAVFVKTDVSVPGSVENLLFKTVSLFGGLDTVISNAGILRAGGLDEMTPEIFEKMTRVNYYGYFHCVKYAAEVLKLQSSCHDRHYTDIIQINSKSGLKGSNKNFAYAGGKFGGIGLTQSFALELYPWRIKVNAICPGNFFEGPLWSDPDKGLFIQYLRTGKVPEATSIEEVKTYYERQVPAGRGCRINDVMKAIWYVIEQEYETGQAIPVTGGQEMLS